MVEPDSVVCRDRRIASVLTLVARDLSIRVSRVQAARVACLEPTYFSKCFHRVIGVTFVRWSIRVRVEAAQRLLRQSDLRVKEVALAVGYDDVTTFERNFRKHTGTSPRACRMTDTQEAPIKRHKTPTKRHKTPRI
jgi:two-component system, response regulator YesN